MIPSAIVHLDFQTPPPQPPRPIHGLHFVGWEPPIQGPPPAERPQ